MQTKYGDIEFGFFEHVAPKTVDHIRKLIQLGAYNTNHFFRVRYTSFFMFSAIFIERRMITFTIKVDNFGR